MIQNVNIMVRDNNTAVIEIMEPPAQGFKQPIPVDEGGVPQNIF
jgi:hypothetical protein